MTLYLLNVMGKNGLSSECGHQMANLQKQQPQKILYGQHPLEPSQQYIGQEVSKNGLFIGVVTELKGGMGAV